MASVYSEYDLRVQMMRHAGVQQLRGRVSLYDGCAALVPQLAPIICAVRDCPAITLADILHRGCPAITSADILHRGCPAITSADILHRGCPAITLADTVMGPSHKNRSFSHDGMIGYPDTKHAIVGQPPTAVQPDMSQQMAGSCRSQSQASGASPETQF